MARYEIPREIPPELKPFVLPNLSVVPTRINIDSGAYGSVETVLFNGTLCAAKRVHNIFQDRSQVDYDTIQRTFKQFMDECKLMSTVRHPHIVQFMGVCFYPDLLPALVMELLVSSLHDLLDPDTRAESEIRSEPLLPLDLKRSIVHDVAKGLNYLHNRLPPVIHRDLSARNVLLTSGMVAKIADLGMARRMLHCLPQKKTARMTRAPGASPYMPPEAVDFADGTDKSEYNASIDIFSLGVVTIFTLCEKFPHKLLPASYVDKKGKGKVRGQGKVRGRDEVERRKEYMDKIYEKLEKSHPLVQLIKQCLQFEPAKRPDIGEVLKHLDQAKDTMGEDEESKMNRLQLLQELNKRRSENERLNIKIQSLQEKISILEQTEQSLQEKVSTLEQNEQRFNDYIQSLQTTLELTKQAYKNQTESLQAEVLSLTQTKEAYKIETECLQAEVLLLTQTKESKSNQIQLLRKRVSTLEQNEQAYKSETESLQAEVLSLTQTKVRFNDEIQSLQEKVSTLEQTEQANQTESLQAKVLSLTQTKEVTASQPLAVPFHAPSQPQATPLKPPPPQSQPQATFLQPPALESQQQTTPLQPLAPLSQPQPTPMQPLASQSQLQATPSQPLDPLSQQQATPMQPTVSQSQPQAISLQHLALQPQVQATLSQTLAPQSQMQIIPRAQQSLMQIIPLTPQFQPQRTLFQPSALKSEPNSTLSQPPVPQSQQQATSLHPSALHSPKVKATPFQLEVQESQLIMKATAFQPQAQESQLKATLLQPLAQESQLKATPSQPHDQAQESELKATPLPPRDQAQESELKATPLPPQAEESQPKPTPLQLQQPQPQLAPFQQNTTISQRKTSSASTSPAQGKTLLSVQSRIDLWVAVTQSSANGSKKQVTPHQLPQGPAKVYPRSPQVPAKSRAASFSYDSESSDFTKAATLPRAKSSQKLQEWPKSQVLQGNSLPIENGSQKAQRRQSQVNFSAPEKSFQKLTLQSNKRKNVSYSIVGNVCTTADPYTAYFCSNNNMLYSYNIDFDEWKELPPPPYTDYGLVCIEGQLTTVGGKVAPREMTNKLLTLHDSTWSAKYPPLNVSRCSPAVVSACLDGQQFPIVAGGKNDTGWVNSIEVFTGDKWDLRANLPEKISSPLAAVSSTMLYIICGNQFFGFSTPLKSMVVDSRPSKFRKWLLDVKWKSLPSVPKCSLNDTTPVSICNEFFIVGGKNNHYNRCISAIYQLYDEKFVEVSRLSEERRNCSVVAPLSEKMVVVGGQGKVRASISHEVEVFHVV